MLFAVHRPMLFVVVCLCCLCLLRFASVRGSFVVDCCLVLLVVVVCCSLCVVHCSLCVVRCASFVVVFAGV